MEKVRRILTLCTKEDWDRAFLYQLKKNQDKLLLEGAVHSFGIFCSPEIDSRETGFSWSRAWLDGAFSQGTAFRIWCFVSDDREEQLAFFEKLKEVKDEEQPEEWLTENCGMPVSDGTDFLITQKGRYLRILIELGNPLGENTEISALHIQMAADHMSDYLPAIYRDDDFTYRFLSIFDSMVSDLEQRIDAVSAELNIHQAGDEMLAFLASWIGLEPETDRALFERQVASALEEYETMYTLEGVRKAIRRLTGKTALLVEGGSEEIRVLMQRKGLKMLAEYLENPYVLFALLEEGTFTSRQSQEEFEEKMKKYLPAGVEMRVIILKKGIQLGSTTYLGMNTRLDNYTVATLDEKTGISNGTIIGGI